MPPKTCPECGADLASRDPRKHAIACFHLAPGSVGDLIAQVDARKNPLQLERVKDLLKGGE